MMLEDGQPMGQQSENQAHGAEGLGVHSASWADDVPARRPPFSSEDVEHGACGHRSTCADIAEHVGKNNMGEPAPAWPWQDEEESEPPMAWAEFLAAYVDYWHGKAISDAAWAAYEADPTNPRRER